MDVGRVCHTGRVQRNRIVSILVAIAAVVLAWFLVQALFTTVWFLLRVVVVLVVAVVVYAAISVWLKRRSDQN